MHPRVARVEVLDGFRVALSFTDGSRSVLDLDPWICGRAGVFRPLQDPTVFRQVVVDLDAGTLVWPNGADIDPDVLYEAAHPSVVAERPGPPER